MPTAEQEPSHDASQDPSDRAARLGARVALLAFLALSSVFALSSTWQLARAVFFEPPPASRTPGTGHTTPAPHR